MRVCKDLMLLSGPEVTWGQQWTWKKEDSFRMHSGDPVDPETDQM